MWVCTAFGQTVEDAFVHAFATTVAHSMNLYNIPQIVHWRINLYHLYIMSTGVNLHLSICSVSK